MWKEWKRVLGLVNVENVEPSRLLEVSPEEYLKKCKLGYERLPEKRNVKIQAWKSLIRNRSLHANIQKMNLTNMMMFFHVLFHLFTFSMQHILLFKIPSFKDRGIPAKN